MSARPTREDAQYRDYSDEEQEESDIEAAYSGTNGSSSHNEVQHDALSFLSVRSDRPPNSNTVWPFSVNKGFSDRVASYIPPGLKRAWVATVKWTKGPDPPRPWRIEPLRGTEGIQMLPLRLLDRYAPQRKHKLWLLCGWYALWVLTFSLVLHKSAFASDVKNYGTPVNIGCGARFWSRGNGCGLNGDLCRPFSNSTLTFRCPASCAKRHLAEPYAVGGKTISYQHLVIGGPMDNEEGYNNAVYRSDSYICGAAIHSGFLMDREGGCGVVSLIGERSNYPGSKRHNIRSTDFDSYFPQSFSFIQDTASQCKDLRWPLLGVSVFFSAALSLFVTSPAVFFASIFTGLFAHVALVSDPPGNSKYQALISTMIGSFLPASFCMVVMYIVAIRLTLRNVFAQIEKTVLWLGMCWIGSLNNYTFDKIPIERLTPNDLKQPGAIPALIFIVLLIFTIALGQAWCFRIEGLMPKYLAIYGILCSSLLFLLTIPELKIRIHHYILALLLLPGTRLQTRPSLMYQGLLVGFFINGIARWGFDSILQTQLELRGDAPLGTQLPIILPPSIHNNFASPLRSNITFEWEYPAAKEHSDAYDGISILVNDVERFKAYRDSKETSFTWLRDVEHEKMGLPEYFRFAYMMGGEPGDYTMPGTWGSSGGWVPMKDGRT